MKLSALVAATLFGLAPPSPAKLAASPDAAPKACPAPSGPHYPLLLRLVRPVRAHQRPVRAWLARELPCVAVACTKRGDVVLSLEETAAHRWLGAHAVFTTVVGAGNARDADDYRAEISPVSFVPEALREHVGRMTFDDDPKRDYTGVETMPCR